MRADCSSEISQQYQNLGFFFFLIACGYREVIWRQGSDDCDVAVLPRYYPEKKLLGGFLCLNQSLMQYCKSLK